MSTQQYPFFPRTGFSDEELAAFIAQEEQRLAQEEASLRDFFIEQQTPVDQAPVEAPPPQPADPSEDGLGYDLRLHEGDILSGALQRTNEERGRARRSVQSEELRESQVEAVEERMLDTPVTAEGKRIGDFMESDIMLGTQGYVQGEDGQPRKAGAAELLIQSIGRQTLAKGLEYEERIAKLDAERQKKYDEARAAGATPDEARQAMDNWYGGQLTEVDRHNRRITETFLGAAVRNTGLVEALANEAIFDALPVFYEVDEQGELQHPDSVMDQFAKLMHDTQRSVYQGLGADPDDVDYYARKVRDAGMVVPWALTGGPVRDAVKRAWTGEDVSLVPLPFQPTNRDKPIDSTAEAGMRVAADTGSFLGNVAMANARGRWLNDELQSLPVYTEQLGDHQWMSLAPAMMGAALAPGPLEGAGKAVKLG